MVQNEELNDVNRDQDTDESAGLVESTRPSEATEETQEEEREQAATSGETPAEAQAETSGDTQAEALAATSGDTQDDILSHFQEVTGTFFHSLNIFITQPLDEIGNCII